MEVLADEDIERIPIAVFVRPIANYVIADFEGKAKAPPRQVVDFDAGKIVFTTGGYGRLAGFRAYESFSSSQRIAEQQLVAVWDTETCALKGVCTGTRLGAIRTGVLGGIAVTALAPASATICALIGSGLQAETQLLGILARQPLTQVRIYSRQRANREAFVERMKTLTRVAIVACDTAEDAVSGADIAVLSTTSRTPVIDPTALSNVSHITTVGPKFRDEHELPLESIADRLIVSDSPQQIRDQGARHMLCDHPRRHEIRHLGEMLRRERPIEPGKSLYLSAGLAGTEVVALDTALMHIQRHR